MPEIQKSKEIDALELGSSISIHVEHSPQIDTCKATTRRRYIDEYTFSSM